MVRASDPSGLLVITQLQPITVVFTIPEDSLPAVLDKLKAGERLPVEAFDREHKAEARHRVPADGGQPDRSDYGHRAAQGGVPER